MSDLKPAIKANFINRRTGAMISEVPLVNSITLNVDARQLATTFDFDILHRFLDKNDLSSHDFVEFYFILKGQPFQVGCGFVEDLVKETGHDSLKFQANGRDFMGQFFNIPFMKAVPISQTTLKSFLGSIVNQNYYVNSEKQDTYLAEYCRLKGIARTIVDLGAEGGALTVPQVTDSMIAPVLQNMADEAFNVIYQNRLGQAVIWGRSSIDSVDTGLTLSSTRDRNVKSLQVKQNYSKVFSEVKVFYTGGEANIDYAATPSNSVFNSDKRARQIFQPSVQTFQTGSLVTTAGVGGDIAAKKDRLAKSILRKSNQNLLGVLIQTDLPFYLAVDGQAIPYEVNQLFTIVDAAHKIEEKMRLAGITYKQTDSQLSVDLLFIPKDTLI